MRRACGSARGCLNVVIARLLRRAAPACATGSCPRSWCSATPSSCAPVTAGSPLGGERLHLYAVDIGRDATGRFSRLFRSHRRRRPAPATRSRTDWCWVARCPTCSSEYGVERIATLLRQGAPRASRAWRPRATRHSRASCCFRRGARDESSFEHAYLARYLGYELVEGRDLTVRDGYVYLKTLVGASPGGRGAAPRRRRLVRSARAARGLVAGGRGSRCGGGAGNVALANPLGVGSRRDTGVEGVPARAMPVLLRRRSEARVGAHVLVR